MKKVTDDHRTLPQNETRNSVATSTASSLEKPSVDTKIIAGIFRTFQAMYGNIWTSQFPTQADTDFAMKTWARWLSGISNEAIGHAIRKVGSMPPTVPAFVEMCRHEQNEINRAIQQQEFLDEVRRREEAWENRRRPTEAELKIYDAIEHKYEQIRAEKRATAKGDNGHWIIDFVEVLKEKGEEKRSRGVDWIEEKDYRDWKKQKGN